MTTAKTNGDNFETKVWNRIVYKRDNLNLTSNKRIYYNGKNYWILDIAVSSGTMYYAIECKKQVTTGTAKEKLPHAIIRLAIIQEMTNMVPILIYDGSELGDYINNNPVMKATKYSYPQVKVMSFNELKDYDFA